MSRGVCRSEPLSFYQAQEHCHGAGPGSGCSRTVPTCVLKKGFVCVPLLCAESRGRSSMSGGSWQVWVLSSALIKMRRIWSRIQEDEEQRAFREAE